MKKKAEPNLTFQLGFALKRAPFEMIEQAYKSRKREAVVRRAIAREEEKIRKAQERKAAAEQELKAIIGDDEE